MRTIASFPLLSRIKQRSYFVDRKEQARRQIVFLVFVVYWLLIFEGAIRRWIIPRHEYLVFFIRDPFVILIYWITLKNRLWPKSWTFLSIGMILSLVCIFLIHFQMIVWGYDNRHLLLAAYGWRNYFYYLPLAFIIAEQFQGADLDLIIKHTLWIAIPSAVLVAMQFHSPASAVVNLGSGLDEAHQFRNLGAAIGHVRPTGFFTSTTGQADFVATLSAMVLSVWIIPRKGRNINSILLWIGTASLCTMIAMSGSRSLVLMTGVCIIAALFTALILNKRRLVLRSWLLPVSLVFGFIILYPILFPKGFEVFVARWANAYASESHVFKYGVVGRALSELFSFIRLLGDTPIYGYLLGIGGNAANRLGWVHFPKVAYEWSGFGGWIEAGLSKHIAELGVVLGLFFIAYRFLFTIWLGYKALKTTRINNSPLPLMLFSFAGLLLFQGQITGHGTHNGYVWLFVGFCLSASKRKFPKHRFKN